MPRVKYNASDYDDGQDDPYDEYDEDEYEGSYGYDDHYASSSNNPNDNYATESGSSSYASTGIQSLRKPSAANHRSSKSSNKTSSTSGRGNFFSEEVDKKSKVFYVSDSSQIPEPIPSQPVAEVLDRRDLPHPSVHGLQEHLDPCQGAGEKNRGYVISNVWSCPACTFDNPNDFLACDVCGTVRPARGYSQPGSQRLYLSEESGKEGTGEFPGLHSEASVSGNGKTVSVSGKKEPSKLGKGIIKSTLTNKRNTRGSDRQTAPSFSPPLSHSLHASQDIFNSNVVKDGKGKSKIIVLSGEKASEEDGREGHERPIGREKIRTESNHLLLDEGEEKIVDNVAHSLTTLGLSEIGAVKTENFAENNLRITTSIISSDPSPSSSTFLSSSSSSLPPPEPSNIYSRPLEDYVPERWVLGSDGNKCTEPIPGKKKVLNLIVLGHVDAGKSTLMGHFLFQLGRVSGKDMHRNRKEAREKGKSSFAYAWVLDEGAEERARGITMSVAMAHFETDRLQVVLMDSPGHRDFVSHMISGASQADAAVLVVDATPGAFEDGMLGESSSSSFSSAYSVGQTREHSQLARSLGVEQLIVAVNKMDEVSYDESAFVRIKSELGSFLRTCGFKEKYITYIPVSGLIGENLKEREKGGKLSEWYSGPTLLEGINSLSPPSRLTHLPLRLPISEIISKNRNLGQTAISGKIESGAIRCFQSGNRFSENGKDSENGNLRDDIENAAVNPNQNTKLLVMPGNFSAVAKAIERSGENVPFGIARAGESVDVGLIGLEQPSCLRVGGVLCHPDFPVPVVTKFEAKVLALDLKTPILRGAQVELHVHTCKEPATISSLIAILDAKTGEVAKAKPRAILRSQSAILQITPAFSVCLEEYSHFKSLGRIALREGGRTLAVGIVTRILESE